MTNLDKISLVTGFDPQYMSSALDDSAHPVTYTLNIKGASDLQTRVIKSKHASVEIPELDIRILPGVNSEDIICDVFGLLSRIETAIQLGPSVEAGKKTELLENITCLKEGRCLATLVLTDPSGLSVIMGEADKEVLNT